MKNLLKNNELLVNIAIALNMLVDDLFTIFGKKEMLAFVSKLSHYDFSKLSFNIEEEYVYLPFVSYLEELEDLYERGEYSYYYRLLEDYDCMKSDTEGITKGCPTTLYAFLKGERGCVEICSVCANKFTTLETNLPNNEMLVLNKKYRNPNIAYVPKRYHKLYDKLANDAIVGYYILKEDRGKEYRIFPVLKEEVTCVHYIYNSRERRIVKVR